MYNLDEINDAIARKLRVTGTAADTARKGQPNRGLEVRLTQAFEEMYDGRVRATAAGYNGRFAVEDVQIEGLVYDTRPDTY